MLSNGGMSELHEIYDAVTYAIVFRFTRRKMYTLHVVVTHSVACVPRSLFRERSDLAQTDLSTRQHISLPVSPPEDKTKYKKYCNKSISNVKHCGVERSRPERYLEKGYTEHRTPNCAESRKEMISFKRRRRKKKGRCLYPDLR